MVPAIFEPWGRDLLDTVAPATGMRLLDVACGTGIVARLAASRVGPTGRVAALDANETMLAVARTHPAHAGGSIEWHHGDATHLPFAEAAFDIVVCQQGLQYMTDRLAALREMRRVLAPRGRLALSIFRRSLGHETLRRAAAPHVGETAAAVVMEPFSFPDVDALCALIEQAGLPNAHLQAKTLTARFPSIDGFIEYQLGGRLASAAGKLSGAARAALVDALREAFVPYSGSNGVEFPMEANVVLAGNTV
jgi:ubiquinone/menaquinone biosynthesis C-methylase UbiE